MRTSFKQLASHLYSIYRRVYKSNLFIIAQKTIQQLYSLKTYVLGIIFLIFGPLFTIILHKPSLSYGALSPQNIARIIKIILITPNAFWILGLALALITTTLGSSLISEEIQTGSIQLTLSRPISRTSLFLGKFLGLFSYGAVLIGGALFLNAILSVLFFFPDIFVLLALIPFFLYLFIYGIIVLFFVVSLTLFISTIFSTSKTSGITGLITVLLIFLGFSLFRGFTGSVEDFYDTFQLYHFDILYHLGNILIGIIEVFKIIPIMVDWQRPFDTYFGIYKDRLYESYANIPYDWEQGLLLGGVEKAFLYTPLLSFLIVISLSILLIFGAIKVFKQKDF